jgi:hypothetical protein
VFSRIVLRREFVELRTDSMRASRFYRSLFRDETKNGVGIFLSKMPRRMLAMDKDEAKRVADMIAVRLRKDLYAEVTSRPIWLVLAKLGHAEIDQSPWYCAVRERNR